MADERIDPWGNAEIRDYAHIFKEFGLNAFPEEWKKSLNHRLFERGIIIAHRDFQKIMQRISSKKPFINITGIASSGFLHLGHKADIDLFKFFKDCKAKNYFAISDIDAYVSREKIPDMEAAKKFAADNLAHALALGLETKDVYVQSRKEPRYYTFAFELGKKITQATFEAIYGHVDLGKVSAGLLQYADILHQQLKEYEGRMPSITGIGLDQDPHARLTRDIAQRLSYDIEVPSFIYFKHQSGLKEGTKMSSSDPDTAIFLNDSSEAAAKKISNAFTGGRNTEAEQRQLGGNPDVCKVHEILLFHHPDSREVKRIYDECRKGKWLCRECKQFTSKFVVQFLKKHQALVKKKMPIAQKIVYGK